LFDRFSLFLGVLFVGRAPVEFDVEIVLFAQVARRILGADTGGLENRVALRFRDHTERDLAGRVSVEHGGREHGACAGEGEQDFLHGIWKKTES
jgi:hypothetical protein